jgi:NAD(P)H dehydrogenase (quinone)
MNTSSNLLVLGVTGQVGKLVAKNLRRKYARLSVGTRRKAHLEELADQFGASLRKRRSYEHRRHRTWKYW